VKEGNYGGQTVGFYDRSTTPSEVQKASKASGEVASVAMSIDRVHMPSSTLDEFIPRIAREVTVLKMDVEKHELFVLKGASEFFRRLQPQFVYIEVWPNETWESLYGYNLQGFHRKQKKWHLVSRGFEVHWSSSANRSSP
jgi:hypothetical protein